MTPKRLLIAVWISVALLGGCGDAPPARNPAAPKPAQAGAGASVEIPPPPVIVAAPETRPDEARTQEEDYKAPWTRPSEPLKYRDVPEGSRDPVVDGLKTLIREMIVRGFKPEEKATLAERVLLILETANLGEEGPRMVQGWEVATTLLDVQAEFRKEGAESRPVDENNVRVAAEALARDLYRKLQPGVGPKRHASGQHVLRASPVAKVPEGYQAITWKTIGGFEYTEGMELPEEVRKLHGKKVGIVGYMLTLEEIENIHEFLLVEAFWSCCFGTVPSTNQVVLIRVQGDRGVEYTSSPVVILGDLDVGEEIEDGFVTSLYRIKATSVKANE